jgi:hypothetical protein
MFTVSHGSNKKVQHMVADFERQVVEENKMVDTGLSWTS